MRKRKIKIGKTDEKNFKKRRKKEEIAEMSLRLIYAAPAFLIRPRGMRFFYMPQGLLKNASTSRDSREGMVEEMCARSSYN